MENTTKKKILKRGAIGAVVVLAALQFVPVDRSNPPIERDVDAPPAVRDVLRRACYDCHSHETAWPWYSRVAPASLLVAHDVGEGRDELNFSRWTFEDAAVEARVRRRVWHEVAEGEMPLWFYVPLHPEARLSDADKETLRAWAMTSTAPATAAAGSDR
jgi:hypothetical protein